MAVSRRLARIDNELPGNIKKESFSLNFAKANAQKQMIGKNLDSVKTAFEAIEKHCKLAIANKVVGGDLEKLLQEFKKKAKNRAKYTQNRKSDINSRISADLDKQRYELLEKRIKELETKYEKLLKSM